MPRKRSQDVQSDKTKILASLPAGIHRIKVRTPEGKEKWKSPTMVGDLDVIPTKKNGKPYLMKQPPGRKMIPRIGPANDQIAANLERKKEALKDDPILEAARKDPESADVLQHIVLGLGEEAASLGFERLAAELNGDPTSGISIRRINALKAMADTWLKRMDQKGAQLLDLDSPPFRAAFQMIMETMRTSLLEAGTRPEIVETSFARFAKVVEGDAWKSEVRNRMKDSTSDKK